MSAVGYSVVGCTIAVEPSTQVNPSPFRTSLPFTALDPRASGSANAAAGPSKGSSGPSMVQVTRFHMRLDDSKTHAMVGDTEIPSRHTLTSAVCVLVIDES
jgi:ribonuclease P/MRP protein subunit RPP1